MKEVRVICAQCCKMVSKFEIWRFEKARCHEIIVFCHGQTDRMILTDQDLFEIGDQMRGQTGVAFQPRKIIPSPSPMLAGGEE